MGRNKKERAYSFKPQYSSFSPDEINVENEIMLNHDELEAIFLMDYQDMYQEDAAKMMNVSRPTLSRIIKNARNKIATAVIRGVKLKINDDKNNFKVAICLTKENSFDSITPKENLVAIVCIEDMKISDTNYIENPILNTKEKPSKVFPETLKKHDINFFITDDIGEGLKNSLIAKGIFVKTSNNIKKFDDILNIFEI